MKETKMGGIKQLLKLTDPTDENVKLLKKLFQDITKVNKSKWDLLLGEINFEVVVDLYVPIYDKFFTYDEIMNLVQFYSSEPGIKLVRTRTDSFSKQEFNQDELDSIERFTNGELGRKYNRLLTKISHEHSTLALEFIDSLR